MLHLVSSYPEAHYQSPGPHWTADAKRTDPEIHRGVPPAAAAPGHTRKALEKNSMYFTDKQRQKKGNGRTIEWIYSFKMKIRGNIGWCWLWKHASDLHPHWRISESVRDRLCRENENEAQTETERRARTHTDQHKLTDTKTDVHRHREGQRQAHAPKQKTQAEAYMQRQRQAHQHRHTTTHTNRKTDRTKQTDTHTYKHPRKDKKQRYRQTYTRTLTHRDKLCTFQS